MVFGFPVLRHVTAGQVTFMCDAAGLYLSLNCWQTVKTLIRLEQSDIGLCCLLWHNYCNCICFCG